MKSQIYNLPRASRVLPTNLRSRPILTLSSHVLEHVTEPLKLARRVAALVQEGGYLLIEVPQDVSTEILQQLQLGDAQRIFTVHEHINYYGALSLRKLMEAVDLEVVAIDAVPIESSMGRQNFIRGLARRSSAR